MNGGHPLAHSELEARLQPLVAWWVSPPAADADDAEQEVLLRLQRGLPGLCDEERFGPQVCQVARHALVAHHRVQARHPVPVGKIDEPAQELPGTTP